MSNDYLQYLYFGYLLNNDYPKWFNECLDENTYNYTLKEIEEKWDDLFDSLMERSKKRKFIVPISGGKDSRAILGAIMDRVETKNIKTISFGAPGQLDYDVGKIVSEKCGISHFGFDLNQVEFSVDLVLDSVRISPWTFFPDSLFNKLARKRLSCEDSSIWTGFLGDGTGGAVLTTFPKNEEESLGRFIKKQNKAKNISLIPKDYNILDSFKVSISDVPFSFDDTWDTIVRQMNCIAPIVTPLKRWTSWNQDIVEEDDYEVISPFINKKWIGYWYGMPLEKRINQKMYLEFFNYKYKRLFNMPSRAFYGASSDRELYYYYKKIQHKIKHKIYSRLPKLGITSNLNLNYLDFNLMFRKRQDYLHVLKYFIDYILKNNLTPWLDLNKMLDDHLSYKKDFGNEFMLIIGFAANMEINSDRIR